MQLFSPPSVTILPPPATGRFLLFQPLGHTQRAEDKSFDERAAGLELETGTKGALMLHEQLRETSIREGVGHVLDPFKVEDDVVSAIHHRLDMRTAKEHRSVPVCQERRGEMISQFDGGGDVHERKPPVRSAEKSRFCKPSLIRTSLSI